MPALAALSVPTWQSLMTQRLNVAPSRDVVALCAAATTAGAAKPAMPALISMRRVREVGSIDVPCAAGLADAPAAPGRQAPSPNLEIAPEPSMPRKNAVVVGSGDRCYGLSRQEGSRAKVEML